MAKLGYSYTVFLLLDLLPLLVIGCLLVVWLVFNGFVFLCWIIPKLCCRNLSWPIAVLQYQKKSFHSLGESFFGLPFSIVNFEVTKRIDTQNIKTTQYVLACRYLSLLTLIILPYVMLVFWDVFLFDQTSTCDNSIDCFVGTVRVNNCSLYNKNPYIVCYNLAFSFGTGFAALGGLVTAFRLLLKFIVKVNLTIYNKIPLKCYRVFRPVVTIVSAALFFVGGSFYLSEKPVVTGPFFFYCALYFYIFELFCCLFDFRLLVCNLLA